MKTRNAKTHELSDDEPVIKAVETLVNVLMGVILEDAYGCVQCYRPIASEDEALSFIDPDSGVVVCPTCLGRKPRRN